MHEFWHDYGKPKYGEKAKFMLHGYSSFTVYIKIEDIYGDIAIGVEIRFDTSKYKLERPLPKRKNKEVVRLMKNELGGKIMTEFAAVAI